MAGARLYQGRGSAAAAAARRLSAASTREDYSVLTSKEVCLTWVWRCAGRASPWSSLVALISPPQTFSAFCCNTAAGNANTCNAGWKQASVRRDKH